MKLYRTISFAEKDDLDKTKKFRTVLNSLEAKQFFVHKEDLIEYINASLKKDFTPPYKFIVEVQITNVNLKKIEHDKMDLDDKNAYSIPESSLGKFNEACKILTTYAI